jgi:hypothetical protein
MTEINAAAILADIATLMTDLASDSATKHAKAIEQGIASPDGRGTDGQSHAYAVSALRLQDILDKYTA